MPFRTGFQAAVVDYIKRKVWGVANGAIADEALNLWGQAWGYTQMRVTAGTTLTAADNGKVIVSAGAGALTHVLPEPAVGLSFMFVNIVDQNMIVNGASANKIIALNNLVSDGITYGTAANKIGATCKFVAIDTDGAGTYKWIFIPMCPHTVTIAA